MFLFAWEYSELESVRFYDSEERGFHGVGGFRVLYESEGSLFAWSCWTVGGKNAKEMQKTTGKLCNLCLHTSWNEFVDRIFACDGTMTFACKE